MNPRNLELLRRRRRYARAYGAGLRKLAAMTNEARRTSPSSPPVILL